MYTKEQKDTIINQQIDWTNCPKRFVDSLKRYIYGVQPGHFLIAVLSNDLSASIVRADSDSALVLYDLVKFIYNEIPASLWGDREKVLSHTNEDIKK